MRTILLAALALAGCDHEPVANSASADAPFALNNAPSEAAMEVRLPGDPYSLRKPLMKLASIQEDGLPLSHRPDGFTEGQAITGYYPNGSVEFFTMPDDGLWKVRLTSGIADRCGTKLTSKKEIEQFIALVTPDADAVAISGELAKPMAEGRTEHLFRGSVRYSVYNDCRHILTVTEMNALPPDKRAD